MKHIALLLISLIFLLTVGVMTAQDAPDCDTATITALLATIQEHTDTAAASDPSAVLDALELASAAIAETRAACDGLAFSGDKDTVLGPVTIPEGVYRAVATTDGYMIVAPTLLDGECGTGGRMSAGSLFLVSEGDATEGAEAVFASAECSVLIEVSNVTSDWTLMFEKVG